MSEKPPAQSTDNPEQDPFDAFYAWMDSLIQGALGPPKNPVPRRIEDDGMIIEGPES